MPDVDREIDRAVREMTDIDAPSHLRARVLDSLDRPRRFRWEWLAAPVAAAALVVLAVILRPVPSIKSLPVAQVVVAPVVLESRSFRLQADTLPAKAGSHGGLMSSTRVRLQAEEQRASTIDVLPLSAPAPISVRPVQPRALDHPDVLIDALPDIAPISIEPLPTGGRH